MYCRCSGCEAVFEVTASVLTAGQGLVRCGCCGEVFNASWNLVDAAQPPATAQVALATLTANAGQPAPFEDWDMPVLDRLVQTPTDGAEPTPGDTLAEPSRAFEPPPARITTNIHPGPIAADTRHARQSPSWHANGPRVPNCGRPAPTTQPATRPASPRAVQRSRIAWQSPHSANPLARSLGTLGCLLLIIALLAQVKLSFVPQLAQFAPLRPILASFCGITGCRLPYRRDLNRLALGRTRVTLHPQVPGAVRVSARLTNRAPFDQPLPTVQLTLTDRAGRIVGRRAYRADAYRITAGSTINHLAAGASTQIVLDLAQPNANTASYQLDALR